MAEEWVAKRVVARGAVQGVFFRASTRERAQEHGVVGWVRNDPEGTVTAHLEGPGDAVEAVIDWIRSGGPPAARLTGVDTSDADAERPDRFAVRSG